MTSIGGKDGGDAGTARRTSGSAAGSSSGRTIPTAEGDAGTFIAPLRGFYYGPDPAAPGSAAEGDGHPPSALADPADEGGGAAPAGWQAACPGSLTRPTSAPVGLPVAVAVIVEDVVDGDVDDDGLEAEGLPQFGDDVLLDGSRYLVGGVTVRDRHGEVHHGGAAEHAHRRVR